METYQKFKLKITNIQEKEEEIKTFICNNNKKINNENFVLTDASIEYKADEVNILFSELKDLVTKIGKDFPNLVVKLKGQEDTTYDSVLYDLNYENGILTILTSDRFYERYPEDYDEYVEFCGEFDIEDTISEDEWDEINDGDVWYFVECEYAKNDAMKLEHKEVIKL